MLFQVYTENGVKKIKYLTADTGTGAPVGSLIAMYKKSSPSGYLYCDGSTFDQTAYPALYQYLGSNVLPDYREFALVGAEENTTDVYNAQTNPNGVIHDHDVYTEGQAKDDQVQGHVHHIRQNAVAVTTNIQGSGMTIPIHTGGVAWDWLTDSQNGRIGDVTRGKRKAVFVYIKATSGLTENQQENVLNTINENLSYSTTEHKTGKKWIDGKPIYSITTVCTTQQTISSGVWADLQASFSAIAQVQIESIVSAKFYISQLYIANEIDRFIVNESTINNGHLSALVNKTLLYPLETVEGISLLTIEYTKTN